MKLLIVIPALVALLYPSVLFAQENEAATRKLVKQKAQAMVTAILKGDYESLTNKIEDIKNNQELEKRKQIEFSEKIDELNQETDTLLEEIDKWQT